MKRDLLARVGRLVSLGYRQYSVTEDCFKAYSTRFRAKPSGRSAFYNLLVIPGAEITQNHIRSKKNSHIVALNLKNTSGANQPADEILKEIPAGALSIACHPHHRTTRRVEIGTCYLWDHRKRVAALVDVWEAANRDDLFSVTSLKHYPYVANSDFHKPKHRYSSKTSSSVARSSGKRSPRLCVRTWTWRSRCYRNGSWAA